MNQSAFTDAMKGTDVLDEAMNILSDAIIYSFQQVVYHLTKVFLSGFKSVVNFLKISLKVEKEHHML